MYKIEICVHMTENPDEIYSLFISAQFTSSLVHNYPKDKYLKVLVVEQKTRSPWLKYNAG